MMTNCQLMIELPRLATSRTVMRGHTLGDFGNSARMWADDRVVKFITGKPSTFEESWSRLLRYSGHWQLLKYGYWLVEDKTTGEFIGEVGFANYKRQITPPLGDAPEVGWVLSPEAHGKGFATETVSAALRWADYNIQCEKTVCIFDPNHAASIRVAEKTGYVTKGNADYSGKAIMVMERTSRYRD